ncbi:hypothetical protein SAMN05192529_12918 [Arachidicoccus rhizosphaerae]|uniref:Uncharacterized protein n=1 Tax=Arachidicoccus rhizosphaerae TaxID=551991 RepID=A0A1H4C9C2_9BACT|nr:hypothetical protein [Arachidicoccus rhizosphaerae]SEA56984.1 hypothetical protein SAMN05192529_12918 [Arachidicoccus rhizosphaerae]
MEELMDFLTELHNEDREKMARAIGRAEGRAEARAEARAEGRAEGMLIAIKNFIEHCPKEFKQSAASIAAIFEVEEDIVKPLLSA